MTTLGDSFADELKAAGLADRVRLWASDGRVVCDPEVREQVDALIAAHDPSKPSKAQQKREARDELTGVLYKLIESIIEALISVVDASKKAEMEALLARVKILNAVLDSNGNGRSRQ